MESNAASDVTDRVPRHVFEGVVWMGVGLCTLTFMVRAYVRVACFRRFLLEDYFMLAALLFLVAFGVLAQVNLGTIYELNHVIRQLDVNDFSLVQELGGFNAALAIANTALKTEGAALLLFVVGIGVVKINYMVFFYRIGHRVRAYLIFWWVAFGAVLSCPLVGLAIIPYGCIFNPPLQVLNDCKIGGPYAQYQANVVKGSVVIDVVSDALVICFPISILWNITISLRQKMTLSAVFALVGLTIAVTILRGIQFSNIDTTWAMFFFLIEYMVSFMIACAISFRSLWGQRARGQMEHDVRRRPPTTRPAGARRGDKLRRRLRHLHDSVLDTFRHLEGTTLDGPNVDLLGLPMPPSGLMTVDFSNDDWAHGLHGRDGHDFNNKYRISSRPGLQAEWAPADSGGTTPVGTQRESSVAPNAQALETDDCSTDRRSRMEVMYI